MEKHDSTALSARRFHADPRENGPGGVLGVLGYGGGREMAACHSQIPELRVI